MSPAPQPPPPDSIPPGDLVQIGEVLKPRGLAGEVKVRVTCDGPDHFDECVASGAVLVWRRAPGRLSRGLGPAVPPHWHRVDSLRFHEGYALVVFQGVDTLEAADALRGCCIGLPLDRLPPAGEEAFYHFELEGLEVIDAEGAVLGTVLEVESGAAHDFLLVRPAGEPAPPFRIPWVDAMVRSVDPAARRIVVTLPPGLIESQR